MSRIVYVQRGPDGELVNPNCYASWDGFTQLGYEVRKFVDSEIPSLPLERSTIVHGNIGPVKAALRRVGAPEPPYLNAPESVASFLGRKCWETTLGEIRTLRQIPVFIKPLHEGKIFTGHVVCVFRDLLETVELPDEYAVLAQEPVQFRSEWRVFVLQGNIIGIGHYKGDPLVYPNSGIVRATREAYTDPVAAFSMDFGITDAGATLLVEMNDGYSLGHYGLSSVRYAWMIEARWDEITRLYR